MESTSTGISLPDTYLLDNAEAIQEAIDRTISLQVADTLGVLAKAIRSALDAPLAYDAEGTFGSNKVYRATITSSLDDLKNTINQQLVTIARIKHLQFNRSIVDAVNNLKEE